MTTVLKSSAAQTLLGVGAIRVFPNPSNGIFWLQLASEKTLRLEISLCNPTGQVLQRRHITAASGVSTWPVETTGLPTGAYTLIAKDEKGGVWRQCLLLGD